MTARSYDARLGFGLYLAFAMAQLPVPESRVVIDLTSDEAKRGAPGLLHILGYCREHCITGTA